MDIITEFLTQTGSPSGAFGCYAASGDKLREDSIGYFLAIPKGKRKA